MQDKLPLPIGTSNYKVVSTEYYYVDKTLLIKELFDERAAIPLFTRPRRFGKTLNMDMLRTFFEKTAEDTSKYFTDKKIWQAGEKYTSQQGKYPVIFLSLKDVKFSNWDIALELLKEVIRNEYSRHSELEGSSELTRADAALYKKIITDTATDANYLFSLGALSRMLHAHYKIAPIIIIDEYDTPIQEGYVNGYYQQAVEFIRIFFSSALKDNPHITLAILTGILRIAKESIFSGLNNIRIYSVLDTQFSNYFGFTAEEVQTMAAYYQASDKLPEIRQWYDGYKFGDTEIYNPWSVLYYFGNKCTALPYWVQTSGNAVIHEILQNLNTNTCKSLRNLLNGITVESTINTNIIYPNLKDIESNIFSFLLMTGYLKAVKTTIDEHGICVCQLAIPNKEIKSIYHNEILSLLSKHVGESIIHTLNQALLTKNAASLKIALGKFLMESISYYDGLKENYYHGLLLGMSIIFSSDYYLLSNRESGEGRYDIQLQPKTSAMPGIIIEIKAASDASVEKLKTLAAAALKQIDDKHYDTELMAHGTTTVHKYGIAFCGKKVEIVTN